MSSLMRHFRRSGMVWILSSCWLFAAWGAPPEPFPTDAPHDGMLLLWSGRTVEGRIVKNGDSYSVRRSSGEMFVPKGLVRLECRDLPDAYHQLHAALPPDDVEERVLLARWCVSNQLLKQARQEVSDALSLDPSRMDLRDMLRKLDESLLPRPPMEKPVTPDRATQAAKSAGFEAKDVESLGGLSRETAQTFMRRIQPMLMNGCALSGCHAADATNGLRLQRVSSGSDVRRPAVERNLAVVLQFVDRNNPRSSPLLTVPMGKHGRRGEPAFSGTRGKEQSTELRDWVLHVVKEQPAAENVAKSKANGTPSASTSGNAISVESKQTVTSRDPFDPAEFNSQTPQTRN